MPSALSKLRTTHFNVRRDIGKSTKTLSNILERLGGKKSSDLHHRNLHYEELFSADLSHESLGNTKAGAFFFLLQELLAFWALSL